MRLWGSKRLSEFERTIVDNVARTGWHCNVVGGGEHGEPAFAYSVGLWESLATPEFIVFGLQGMLMYDMLAGMTDQLRSGEQLVDGARIGGLLRDFDCIARPVHPTQIRIDYFNSAMWYRRHRAGDAQIAAFQLFWPGKEDGLFPWEPGCDPFVRECQPQLYLPRAEAD